MKTGLVTCLTLVLFAGSVAALTLDPLPGWVTADDIDKAVEVAKKKSCPIAFLHAPQEGGPEVVMARVYMKLPVLDWMVKVLVYDSKRLPTTFTKVASQVEARAAAAESALEGRIAAAVEGAVGRRLAEIDNGVELRLAAMVSARLEPVERKLREEIGDKDREIAELRQRLADADTSLLDIVSGIGQICRQAAEGMGRSAPPAAPPMPAPAAEMAPAGADESESESPAESAETPPPGVTQPQKTNRLWRVPLVSSLVMLATGGLILAHYL